MVCIFGFLRVDEGIDPYGFALFYAFPLFSAGASPSPTGDRRVFVVVRVSARGSHFCFLRVDEGIDPYGFAHILCIFGFFRQEQAPALQATGVYLVLYVSAPVVRIFGFLRVDEGIDPYGFAHILCISAFFGRSKPLPYKLHFQFLMASAHILCDLRISVL